MRIRRESKNHKKQRQATLKRGDDNELERSRRLAVETEEERRAKLENDAATKGLRLTMEMDEERKARLERW